MARPKTPVSDAAADSPARAPSSALRPPPSTFVLPGDRPAAEVAFEAGVVELFVDAAGLLGVPKSVAAIYGLVFASSRALSFAEICARLDFSNGSISQGLRQLREVGAVREVSAETDRAARYEPDTEMRQLLVRFMEQRVKRQIEQGRSRLAGLQDQAKAMPAADRSVLVARVRKLQTWHDRSRAVIPLVKTFLKLGG